MWYLAGIFVGLPGAVILLESLWGRHATEKFLLGLMLGALIVYVYTDSKNYLSKRP